MWTFFVSSLVTEMSLFFQSGNRVCICLVYCNVTRDLSMKDNFMQYRMGNLRVSPWSMEYISTFRESIMLLFRIES